MNKTKYIIVHGPDQGRRVTPTHEASVHGMQQARFQNGELTILPLHWLKPQPQRRTRRPKQKNMLAYK